MLQHSAQGRGTSEKLWLRGWVAAEHGLFVGIGGDGALDDGARVPPDGGEDVLEPILGRAAVIVGEDQRVGAGQFDGGVAICPGQRGTRGQAGPAQALGGGERVLAEHAVGLLTRRVMAHDDLPPRVLERLLRQRIQQPAQAQGPIVRGDDD